MAWDWIEKGAKRLQEIGGEYKQHQALIERLLTLDPVAAQLEVSQLWPSLDDRGRAGVKMTLAGLTLSQPSKGGFPRDERPRAPRNALCSA